MIPLQLEPVLIANAPKNAKPLPTSTNCPASARLQPPGPHLTHAHQRPSLRLLSDLEIALALVLISRFCGVFALLLLTENIRYPSSSENIRMNKLKT